ncbi:XRE family transcriptional regulator [Streptomyces sp. NBS 14/10]|uniref:helix-turn-helix domain-containing protein n=1 Tax=Streptomyces sp. NBS 14/10 TaxID=1945643 RepID=UPI000B7ECEB0|nr:XRE family transcriptional regulator [Streptomyces sp. NBS 14/10]KAK1184920.1 XRE family transcriptional regulator [Streptomyces sp. NBS 14/10]
MAPPSGQSTSSTAAAVGAQIRRRREQRGVSGSELARRAGLSKATLSQLEAGKGNPTIETLDALAIALRIPLTDLLTRDTDPGPVFVAGTDLAEHDVGRELLRRISSGHSLEIWRLRMPAHTELAGVPHATGTVEHLLVATGRLTAGPTDSPRLLGSGDLLAFAGDAPHIYRTDTEPADVTVVIASPIVS